jgi:hypothetical protein
MNVLDVEFDEEDTRLLSEVIEQRCPHVLEEWHLRKTLREQRIALGEPQPAVPPESIEEHRAWLLKLKVALSKLKVARAEKAIRDAEYKRTRPERGARQRAAAESARR